MRAAFGVPADPLTVMAHGSAWRCGQVVLNPVASTAEAVWVAHTIEGLHVDGVRLPRPLRSTDGRWVVAGWGATRYVSGRVEPRYDEVVAVAERLHTATADLARPDFLANRVDSDVAGSDLYVAGSDLYVAGSDLYVAGSDLYAAADAAAWGDAEPDLDPDRGGAMFTGLAAARRPVGLRDQVVHGDLFGNVLFAGAAPPAVIGFIPYWRPREWAAAVVVVDAVAWGGADDGLVQRWSSLDEWPQVLLRALLFRAAVHATHPRSTAQSLAGLQRAAALVRGVL